MQPYVKSLLFALVALAVLAIVFVWLHVNRKDYTPPPTDVVFADLRGAVTPSNVGRITVTGEKDKEATIA